MDVLDFFYKHLRLRGGHLFSDFELHTTDSGRKKNSFTRILCKYNHFYHHLSIYDNGLGRLRRTKLSSDRFANSSRLTSTNQATKHWANRATYAVNSHIKLQF